MEERNNRAVQSSNYCLLYGNVVRMIVYQPNSQKKHMYFGVNTYACLKFAQK